MKLSKTEITDIQHKVLDIFKEVKKICEKLGIRYYAIAGTAIGTIRHKGFIPWDDDIDIAMPSEDLDKFLAICKTLLPDYLEVRDRRHTGYGIRCVQIIDSRTTQVDKDVINVANLYSGIHIDIMPLNGVPTNKLLFSFHMNVLTILYTISSIRAQYGKPNHKKGVRRLIKWIILPLLLLRSTKFYNDLFQKASRKYEFDDEKTEFLARTWAFDSHDGMKSRGRYYKEDFVNYIEMPFEDTTIRVPVGYDRYLESLYPNYMTLPPKNKRKPRHSNGIVDLELPYTYYLAKKEGKTIGYVPGSFDMFHIGHLNILKQARQRCDYIIAGVNSDNLMFLNKNKYPIVPETERLEIVSSISFVDSAVLVETPDKIKLHDRFQFDIMFVGGDYAGKLDNLERKLNKKGTTIQYFEYTKNTSSTKLRCALDQVIKEKKSRHVQE